MKLQLINNTIKQPVSALTIGCFFIFEADLEILNLEHFGIHLGKGEFLNYDFVDGELNIEKRCAVPSTLVIPVKNIEIAGELAKELP